LPLNAWSPKAFKKVANIWGSPLLVDEDPNETVSIGKVCIKTKILGHIKDTCKVTVLGKSFNVSVNEFAWDEDNDFGNSKPEKKETSSKDNPETPVEDSKTFSKPPGFEAFNSNSNNSCTRKSFARHNQSSHCSSAPVKSSRINNSHTNPLSKHGSMIEALVSQIEMGKVLGYDME
ncbi:hypothetical protein Tco_0353923, partial [Tanacetum coccineum]